MPENPPRPEDVADILENLARRIRTDGGGLPGGVSVVVPDASFLVGEDPVVGAIDVFSDDEAVTVTVETRNVDANAVHVSLVDGRLLLLLGEGSGALRREVPLPRGVNEDRSFATFRNGVLDVVLPTRG